MRTEPSSLGWCKSEKQTVLTGGAESGVRIHYTKRSRLLSISGHYDHIVDIESVQIPLWEFLQALEIPEKDLVQALYGDTP